MKYSYGSYGSRQKIVIKSQEEQNFMTTRRETAQGLNVTNTQSNIYNIYNKTQTNIYGQEGSLRRELPRSL
jgi:hypothetical protein